MKVAVALIYVMLSNHGYWFAQQEGTIEIRPATGEVVPGSYLAWELWLDNVRFAEGQTEPLKVNEPAIVKLKAPSVRVMTTVAWRYVWRDPAGKGRELSRGEHRIHIFPIDLLESTRSRLADEKLLVVDPGKGIAGALEAAKVPHERVDDVSGVRVAAVSRLIVVAPDVIDDSPFAQGPLLAQAEAGASVFVFAQSKPQALAGYPLKERRVPGQFELMADHPLLAERWPGHIYASGESPRAIQLPPDEPALAVVAWPAETRDGVPTAPIDALLVTKSIGKGRIVLCQLPLGDPQSDPRAAIMLRNAIDYMLTRPEPTLAPSQRARPKETTPTTIPTIQVLPGANP
jgi:hypothetical protein